MKSKKIISILLILVFVLQLLPVKQAVRYFCFDNSITEEIIAINESSSKKIIIADEDHNILNDHLYLLHPGLLLNNTFFGMDVAVLSSSHATDIETPPPNAMIG